VRLSVGPRFALVFHQIIRDLPGLSGEQVKTVIEPFQSLQKRGITLIEHVEAVEERFLSLIQDAKSLAEVCVVHRLSLSPDPPIGLRCEDVGGWGGVAG
jgi:hypothetical protein